MVQSYAYDPQANELQVTTKANPNISYVYGDVSPAQAEAFHTGESKGKAWAAFKQGSSPLVAKILNGERIPVRPVLRRGVLDPGRNGSTGSKGRKPASHAATSIPQLPEGYQLDQVSNDLTNLL